MKKLGILLFFSLCISAQSFAQNYTPLHTPNWPESNGDSTMFTVGGERHGISFFKQHRFPEVEYEAGEELTFDTYHTTNVMYAWYERWAEQYPDIVDLYCRLPQKLDRLKVECSG